MNERRLEIDLGRPGCAIVLDGGAAPETLAAMLQNARRHADALGASDPRVAWMGTGALSNLSALERPGRRAGTRPSVRLIGPALESLLPNLESRIIVLTAGPIFDLEDWEDDGVLARTLVVNHGPGPVALQPVQVDVHLAGARTRLALRRLTVRFGEGSLASVPLEWSEPSATFDGTALHVGESRGTLVIRTVAEGSATVSAAYEESDGDEEPVPVRASTAEPPPLDWRALSADETAILRRCLAGEPFECLVCGRTHDPDVLECDDAPDGVFHRIYTPLQQEPSRTLAAVRLRGERGEVAPLPRSRGVWARDGAVVVPLADGPTRFAHDEGSWRAKGRAFLRYIPLRDPEEAYGITL